MSVHYEIYGDEPEMIDKNVRVCFLNWVADNMPPKGKGAEP